LRRRGDDPALHRLLVGALAHGEVEHASRVRAGPSLARRPEVLARRRAPYVRELAPAGLFHLGGDEFADRYVARLDKIGADTIAARLADVYAQERKPLALMCFENVHAGQLCHRRLWASWWQERTGQTVPELEPPREVAPGATPPASGQLTLDAAAGGDR